MIFWKKKILFSTETATYEEKCFPSFSFNVLQYCLRAEFCPYYISGWKRCFVAHFFN